MDLTAIESARDEYLSFYRATVRQYRGFKRDLVPELLILLNGPPEWPEMHRLWRGDLFWKEDGNPKPGAVELNPPAEAPPVTITPASGLRVTVDPFVWHWCQLFTDHSPSGETLNQWFHKWIDDAEEMSPDEFGLSGVIHQMTPVDQLSDCYVFTVDFGSAPTQAFLELLDVLAGSGVSQVRVGSPDHQ